MTQRSCSPGRFLAASGLRAAYLATLFAAPPAFAADGPAIAAPSAAAPAAHDPRETPLVSAVKRAKASVVNIHSVKTAYDEGSVFGSRQGRKVNGMGTGIVIDPRGYIVTNNHVVAGVESLRCTLVDGSVYEATAISVDPKRDLAIIKVEPTRPLTVMPLGTSSDLMLGETVVAVGNAFGYEHTVTAGIVSALHRDVEVNETQSYENLIQTDASINPGNSGGPLLNLAGEVVGINVAIRAGAQRIGFAIPIDDARLAIAELFNTERIDRTAHGLQTEDLKNAADRRLLVRSAASTGPAAQAGFQPGDVIIEAAGQPVVDRVDLERALLGRKAGQSADIVVTRSGERKTLSMTLAAASGQTQTVLASAPAAASNDSAWSVLGLKLGVAEANAVAGTKYRGGLKVAAVRQQSPAARSGIQAGDVLVGLQEWETISIDNVDWVLKKLPTTGSSPMKFYIIRNRETRSGEFRLAAR